jgi:hypothetical protein
MSLASRLFKAWLAILLLIPGSSANLNSGIFDQISDINLSNESLTCEVDKYLNGVLATPIDRNLPLISLLSNFKEYKENILRSEQPVMDYTQIETEFIKIFQEEENTVMTECSTNLISRCKEATKSFAMGFFRKVNTDPINTQSSVFHHNNDNIDDQNNLNKLIQVKVDEYFAKIVIKYEAHMSSKAKIEVRVKETIEKAHAYVPQIREFVKFREHPIEHLLTASMSLIESESKVIHKENSDLSAVNKRVFEYVKAMSLISNKQKLPMKDIIKKIIFTLISNIRPANSNEYVHDPSDQNIQLIRRIVKLFKDGVYRADLIATVYEYFKGEAQSEEEEADMPSILSEFYAENDKKHRINEGDFTCIGKKLKIIDYVLYLWNVEPLAMTENDINMILDNFEFLLFVTGTNPKFGEYNNLLTKFQQQSSPLKAKSRKSSYESYVGFITKYSARLPTMNKFETLNLFLDDIYADKTNEDVNEFYIPLKISLALEIPTEESQILRFSPLYDDTIKATKKFLRNPKSSLYKSKIFKLVSKQRKLLDSDLELEEYLEDLSEGEYLVSEINESEGRVTGIKPPSIYAESLKSKGTSNQPTEHSKSPYKPFTGLEQGLGEINSSQNNFKLESGNDTEQEFISEKEDQVNLTNKVSTCELQSENEESASSPRNKNRISKDKDGFLRLSRIITEKNPLKVFDEDEEEFEGLSQSSWKNLSPKKVPQSPREQCSNSSLIKSPSKSQNSKNYLSDTPFASDVEMTEFEIPNYKKLSNKSDLFGKKSSVQKNSRKNAGLFDHEDDVYSEGDFSEKNSIDSPRNLQGSRALFKDPLDSDEYDSKSISEINPKLREVETELKPLDTNLQSIITDKYPNLKNDYEKRNSSKKVSIRKLDKGSDTDETFSEALEDNKDLGILPSSSISQVQKSSKSENDSFNKISKIPPKENLIQTVAGNLTQEQYDAIKYSSNIDGVMKEFTYRTIENGKVIEYVVLKLVRPGTPCNNEL